MAKVSKAFVCQACGAVHARWSGKCAACGQWNSIIEETAAPAGPPALVAIRGGKGRAASFEGLGTETRDAPRLRTGMAEFDRVLGGGLVPGSAILVGGDPGIGKSTLLLQAAAALAAGRADAAYITGEEAIEQVRLRAERLGVADRPVLLAAASSVRDIVGALDRAGAPDLVVIDS